MTERIPSKLRRTVQLRAKSYCEYCYFPEQLAAHTHEVDHIIPIRHTGQTQTNNLAYACFECNRYKGPNIASIDPLSNKLTALFNPRTQEWNTHFYWDGGIIMPLSPEGRVTIEVLQINLETRVADRQDFIAAGVYFII